MHDCARTQARLIDLVFGEAADAARLGAEVGACPDCRAEHRALEETLRACGRAAEAARPAEDFWLGYHARLAARLAAPDATTDGAPRAATARDRHEPSAAHSSTRAGWLPPAADATERLTPATSRRPRSAARLRRALATTWRVPAPAAVAVALLTIGLCVFALVRPAPVRPAPVAVEPPARAVLPVEVRTVEVPVVHERIVTRTVYVARGDSRARRGARAELALDTGRGNGGEGEAKSAATAETLAGFRPASDARLRVIKGGEAHDK